MSDSVRTCPVCGCRVPPGAATCIYCGAPLDGASIGGEASAKGEASSKGEAPATEGASVKKEASAQGKTPSEGEAPAEEGVSAEGGAVGDAVRPGDAARGARLGAGDARPAAGTAGEHADAPASDGEDELFSAEFYKHDAAVHPHGAAHRKAAHRPAHAARPALDEAARRKVKVAVCAGAAVLVVALVVVVALAAMSDMQLKQRAEAASAQSEESAKNAPSFQIPAAGWSGSFAASDGSTFYWSTGSGIYALDAEDMGEDADSQQLVGDTASALAVHDDELVYLSGESAVKVLPLDDEAEPQTLYTCEAGERLVGLVLHDDTAFALAVRAEGADQNADGAGGEASAGGASAEGDGTAVPGVRLLRANIAAETPSWDEAYAAEGTEAWLFDTGSQLAVVSSTGSTWVLAQAGYDVLDANEGEAVPVSFQSIAQADEHLLAVCYDGSSIYKTVEGSDGMAGTSRQELSGAFSDYTNVTGTPMMAGSSSLCAMLTESGGFAWAEEQSGFLHDATDALEQAGVAPSLGSSRIAVDGTTVWLLADGGNDAGTLACINCSKDPVGVTIACKAGA